MNSQCIAFDAEPLQHHDYKPGTYGYHEQKIRYDWFNKGYIEKEDWEMVMGYTSTCGFCAQKNKKDKYYV